MTDGPIHIAVNVTDTAPQHFTFLERVAIAMGGPDKARKACNLIASVTMAGPFIYIAATLYGLLFRHYVNAPLWLFIAQLLWIPFALAQITAGGIRFAALSLQMKAVEHYAAITEDQFHARVGEAVTAALDAHFREKAAPPTLN